MTAAGFTARLSKSRFVAGWQCHKLLWWKVHEPGATELEIDAGLQDLFDQGRQVAEEARKLFPGGVLIDPPPDAYGARIEATRTALDFGAVAVYEASFEADAVFVAVDVLLREGGGFTLIEIKSSTEVKEEHLPDAAVQTHVLRQCGVDVRRIEIMHLNQEFRHPDAGELFVREDVTRQVEALMPEVPRLVAEQLAALRGPLPEVAIGGHCSQPRKCPFWDRCWPAERFSVTKLYRGRAKGLELLERGVKTMDAIPPAQKLTDIQRRQKRSAERDALVVEPGLGAALEPFSGRLGFLDFETISRAIPVWPGLGPWRPTTVQFSYHEARPGGGYSHVGWLAEGPEDPRDELARVMLETTQHAERIVMYSAYERTQIKALAEALPRWRSDLLALEGKLIDLLPVMRNNLYHPDFHGSFSLKYALTPMVPSLTYRDLLIQEGMTASVEIWRLLFVAHLIPPAARDQLRADLLAYCERDTLAMVKLLERLRELAGG